MSETPNGDETTEELEAVRHFLWLNPDRCNLFFADQVLIVEGLSEQVLANYLLRTEQVPSPAKGMYVLECSGKFDIPRFMRLCEEMKIFHSVLYDLDCDKTGDEKAKHERAAEQVKKATNKFTTAMHSLPENLEKFLGLALEKRDRWKASKILLAVQDGTIDQGKLGAFKSKLRDLLGIPTQ